MVSSKQALELFHDSITLWHLENKPVNNPHPQSSIKFLLFKKSQIDTIQWHLEDEIRRVDLEANIFVGLKREIDSLNQQRTDTVEKLDDFIIDYFADYPVLSNSRLNSESPAWMLDRMSILELKIYHMKEQASRTDITVDKAQEYKHRYEILCEQRNDLSHCFDELLQNRQMGINYFKVYRQMKLYNDPLTNPALYRKK